MFQTTICHFENGLFGFEYVEFALVIVEFVVEQQHWRLLEFVDFLEFENVLDICIENRSLQLKILY